jgi:hypothetical protein
MATDHGWISYGPGENSHLTDEQRDWVEGRIRQRQEGRGALLGVVEVRVYENACEPQVGFPREAMLGVDTDASVISEMVARARTELAEWR